MGPASSSTDLGRISVSLELRGGVCWVQDSNNTDTQTVLTNVQLDPGSAEFLQPVISNLTNITMLTSTLAVRHCPVTTTTCASGHLTSLFCGAGCSFPVLPR